jgi:hypothetical protein
MCIAGPGGAITGRPTGAGRMAARDSIIAAWSSIRAGTGVGTGCTAIASMGITASTATASMAIAFTAAMFEAGSTSAAVICAVMVDGAADGAAC